MDLKLQSDIDISLITFESSYLFQFIDEVHKFLDLRI